MSFFSLTSFPTHAGFQKELLRAYLRLLCSNFYSSAPNIASHTGQLHKFHSRKKKVELRANSTFFCGAPQWVLYKLYL
jgi:hypothetical protein